MADHTADGGTAHGSKYTATANRRAGNTAYTCTDRRAFFLVS
jgi:hypothetical protein